MSYLSCSNCGKKHESAEKNCAYCGENLEKLIMQYKNDRLPIKFNDVKQERRIMTKYEYNKYYKKGKPLPKMYDSDRFSETKKERNAIIEFLFDLFSSCV